MTEPNTQPSRILIIKPSALGDITLSLPALSSLRASFPQAKITWLVRREFAPLLDGAGDLDDVLIFDRKGLGKWWWHPKAFAALMRFFGDLRKGRFDLVIDLQGLFRTAFFGWLSGSRRRFGMAGAREFAALFYTDRIRQDSGSVHLIDYYHKIVAAAGAKRLTAEYHLTVPEKGLHDAREALARHGIDNSRYVVFVTGSAHQYKCWPIERFAELADRIYARFHVPVVAVGGRKEQPVVNKLKALCSAPLIDLTTQTDLHALAGVLKGAALVVSNDTGPGHIAVALDVPVIIIFGMTNPQRVGPYGKPHGAVAIDAAARGTAIESSHASHNIGRIDVDRVFAEAVYHLAACKDSQP
ncbi:MAG TPA: glycosyltransferase family 9 protein [Anaerohalosphaeraceae bacterium]|jgi:heptosyltransferase-1|nr:glycosyltransferase family 9 protein [Anaerohalosphaeraceae bacterium]HRT50779.1 glycosyltransferase family 9 protein [Anaerohalosphaeraceae bacterium]HRT86815.1 glycosyltransferase family 9 protein [Anaerohalosphaeraceae bacterium]